MKSKMLYVVELTFINGEYVHYYTDLKSAQLRFKAAKEDAACLRAEIIAYNHFIDEFIIERVLSLYSK